MRNPTHPFWPILTMTLGAWLFIVSGGITNIALPYLTTELNVSEAQIVWVTVAFQLAAVSCTIPLAGLSETVGIRNMYVGGLLLFGLGSVFCGLSADFTQLAIARVVQGLGAAAISSVNAALVRRCVSERVLGRVLGWFAVVVGAAQGASPIIGSTILELANWRWLFFYDLPITVGAISIALFAIPRDIKSNRKFDTISALLSILALGLGFFAIDQIARTPMNLSFYGMFVVAVLAGIALVKRQRHRPHPLFPVDLFRLPIFILPGGIGALTFGAQAIALTALPFLLVSSLDLSLLQAGAMISILPLATLIAATVSGVTVDRFPNFPASMFGCLTMTVGFIGLYLLSQSHDRMLLTGMLVVLGVGFAFFQNHNSKSMILAAPIDRVGAAGGIQSTVRVVGMMIGPAIVGICFHFLGPNGTFASIMIAAAMTLSAATLAAIVLALKRREALSA